MDISCSPIETFLFVVAYWHAFDMACPKHGPWKGSSNLKLSQFTTYSRVLWSSLLKLDPLLFTHCKISFNWIILIQESLEFHYHCLAHCFGSFKNPMVICFGCQSKLIKFTTSTKTSFAFFNIQRLKKNEPRI
jgi:hypothetical protein